MNLRHKITVLLLVTFPALLYSCMKSDGPYITPEGETADFLAILTIKKTPTDTVYFQLDDSTTIYAENYQRRFTGMQKLFCDISVTNKPVGSFKYKGTINWAEPIDRGEVTSDSSKKGELGLDIIEDWMTGVEDGYLTVHYNTWWGLNPVQHSFYVITGTNPDDPYELVLKQDEAGDKKEEEGDAIICFDINTLPDTGDEYKELTLKWTTCGGKASEKKFKFKTRK